jgi:hypothetical protein
MYENYTRKSGEGLSLVFVIIWLLGDILNLVGGIMAGLIPTVILLAIYVSPRLNLSSASHSEHLVTISILHAT